MAVMGALSAGTLKVGLLGPLQVSLAGQPVELPAGRLPALVAVLAMSAGQTVSVDRLATAVWGSDVSVDARANVQSNVRRLRRLLGASLITTRGGGYALEVLPDHVDALRFVRLLDVAAADGQRDRLVEALRLWRGTPFDGVRSDWLEQTEAPRLQERYLAGLERRIDLDLAAGSVAGLAAELGELTGRYPLRESLWVRLLVVLGRSGRSAEALERYEAIRVRLAEELGTDPGPELRQVHADLLSGGVPAQRLVPRQLPAGTDVFTGRDAALRTLDGLIGSGVVVVAGTAGVGKTSLAVQWAHQVADRFPDGSLYVNLRGFDPSGSPMEPVSALRRFFDALQVPPHAIPASLDAQAGLYRSLLAGRQMLVLLDNARDASQVVPLLPGVPGCLVLVTSRDQLPGLIAFGARPVSLDLLGREESVELLARRIGHDRLNASPSATDEIITRCAGLPLALAIVAARAATHLSFPLAALASQLGSALDGFDGGDSTTSVRAVFSWSYRSLSAPAARLFRLVGLHPGPGITANAAASLAGCPVRSLLAELTRACLLVEHVPGRYAFHDLLRAYSVELADPGQEAATERMLDHYVHTAHGADLQLFQHGETVVLGAALPGVVVSQLSGHSQAMAWFDAEHPVLLGVIDLAARNGFHRHVCHLAWALFVFLHRRGHWHSRAAVQHAALSAAAHLDDRSAQARSHRYLGFAYADLGRFSDAHRHLDEALTLADYLAWTHYYLSLVHGLQGSHASALSSAQQSLDHFRAADDRAGQAIALNDVGWYQGKLGNYKQALVLCTQAMTIHQELDNRTYQAHTWSCLGEAHHELGDQAKAIDCYLRACALFREFGDRYGEAGILLELSSLYRSTGDTAAHDASLAAKAILGSLDPPAVDQIRTSQPGESFR